MNNSIKRGLPCLHLGGSGRTDPSIQCDIWYFLKWSLIYLTRILFTWTQKYQLWSALLLISPYCPVTFLPLREIKFTVECWWAVVLTWLHFLSTLINLITFYTFAHYESLKDLSFPKVSANCKVLLPHIFIFFFP